jgi:hypothetical protein
VGTRLGKPFFYRSGALAYSITNARLRSSASTRADWLRVATRARGFDGFDGCRVIAPRLREYGTSTQHATPGAHSLFSGGLVEIHFAAGS